MTIVYVILLLFPAGLAAIYLVALVIARSFGVRDVFSPSTDPTSRIVILVPAHNEESVIGATLDSIAKVNYPSDLVSVVVVADNCSDRTVEITESKRAICWQRQDATRPGKGHALRWAIERLLQEAHDAVLVLDADCSIDPDALRVIDSGFQQGALAIQANHRVLNPDISPISYAGAVGRTLEYELFFAPKSRLRLPVMLVGTGMAFHRSLLQRIPWSAESCAEDTEYTLQLARQGERVRFAANAYIGWTGVESKRDLQVQRARWASGNLSFSRSQGVGLIIEGVLRRSLLLADIGWTLLIVSRPLVLLHAGLTLFGGILINQFWPTATSNLLMKLSFLLIPLYAAYFAAGVLVLGLNAARIRHLAVAPFVVCKLVWIAVSALSTPRQANWNRTPRS